MRDVEIRPLGDAAVLAVFGDKIDPALLRRVWSLTRALSEVAVAGVVDVVPAFASVLVRFDPFLLDLPRAMAMVRGAAERAVEVTPGRSRVVRIAACFGRQWGADFELAAHELGMRELRLREMFCKPDYRVAFIGFLAGFPYLLGLPPALSLPRLASPRPRVPGGSVAIAAGQCGIYPRESPGGWWLLGRTLAPLFHARRDPPALLAPGDVVRFEPVDALERTAAVEFGG